MGLQGYVGTVNDAQRVRRQEERREQERAAFEERQRKAESLAAPRFDGSGGALFKEFGSGKSEGIENAFRNETVGLVTRDDFARKRANVQERFEEEEREKKKAATERALRERRRRRAEHTASASKLSFAGFDDDGDGDDGDLFQAMPPPASRNRASASGGVGATGDHAPGGGASDAAEPASKVSKYGKNPDVETAFLPDRDRELAAARVAAAEAKAKLAAEEAAKATPLKVTYSYWNGSGHRKDVRVRQGDSIGAFLALAQKQLAPRFREVRSSGPDDLLYVKEDVILPPSLTFHELITKKARGKSGPLFHFDVHDDVRLQADARIEKDESHAGKVVERHWYKKNKHVFPASRWEEYDPNKVYDKYTIHDK